jgi:exopolysaccharide biosynthesis polyprenyl glycosylphosphotransferase
LPWLDAGALVLVLTPGGGGPLAGLLAAGCAAAVHAGAGLHRPRLTRSVLDDLPALLGGAVTGAAVATLLAAPPSPLRPLLGLSVAAAVVLLVLRLVAEPLERRHRRRGPGCPTLIIGTAALGAELGRVLLADPRYGLRPVAYLDEPPAAARRELPAPLRGRGPDRGAGVEARRVRCVVVAFGAGRPAELVDLLRANERHRLQVLYVPRFYEMSHVTRRTDAVAGIPLVRLPPAARYRPGWRGKRALDVVLALFGLALAAPVLAVCALALRWEGGPGVLFRQQRVGRDEQPFTLLKLRTLRPSSDWESRTRWSVADDPRLGPVGKLLRAASLDELPQLVNVLRGDMSMVGPRPERPFFVEEFSARFPGYAARHRVPVGLTGWAAVNGLRGNTSIRTRADFDNSYIENWSLWLDVKILLRTVAAVLVRSGG